MGDFKFSMSIIGHKKTQEFFTKVIERGVLSHAYILVGSEHIGKETVATWVASELLKVAPGKVPTHPDVRMIRREYDAKNNRFKRDIPVGDMRDLLRFASESSFLSNGYKVIIIPEADRLNTEAGNALLKILEEPPVRTVFFLLYQNVAAVLPTIGSRAQTINLTRASDKELTAGLLDLGFESEQVKSVVPFSLGLPGQAIQWLINPDIFNAFKQINYDLTDLMGASLTKKFNAVEPWFAAAKDEGGVDYVVEHLEQWRQTISTWLGNDISPITPIQTVTVLDYLDDTISALRKNGHPPLTVQNFLLSLP